MGDAHVRFEKSRARSSKNEPLKILKAAVETRSPVFALNPSKARVDSRSNLLTTSEGAEVHLRRCHICDQISEVENGVVKHCHGCGKAMAPFFFFVEKETPVISDSESRPAFVGENHPPIRGLTAFW